ncbi:MAG: PaaI family thioesterase [Lachnospiraceae bacterium]|nr:PaaI family thioesterase [Candidatus Colinaster scatohippi]
MRSLEEIRAKFANDIFATEATGIVIEEAREGYCKCSLSLDRRHYNAVKQVMGGALATLIDFSFAVAANCEDHLTVTSTCQINYLSPVKGDMVFAVAEVVKDGKRSCYYEVTISDVDKTVARATVSGMHL